MTLALSDKTTCQRFQRAATTAVGTARRPTWLGWSGWTRTESTVWINCELQLISVIWNVIEGYKRLMTSKK
eukprot:scaffold42841_cov233-Skeletonema_dohrnii-CCMP3373.AAC.3